MSDDAPKIESHLLAPGASCVYRNESLEVATNLPMTDYLLSPGWAIHDLENLKRCPEYAVWDRWQESFDTPSTIFGTATHCAILEPEELDKRYGVRPPGHGNLKAVKEGIAAMMEMGVIPLKEEEWDALRFIRENVQQHDRARELIDLAVLKEVSLATKIPDTNILAKLRPDALLPEAEMIIDVKTTKAIQRSEFLWECSRYGYHRSAAWYLDRMRDAVLNYDDASDDGLPAPLDEPVGLALAANYQHHIILAIENKKPYAVQVFQLEDAALEVGRWDYEQGLEILKRCQKSGVWEALPGGIQPIELPFRDYANHQRTLDELVAAGKL